MPHPSDAECPPDTLAKLVGVARNDAQRGVGFAAELVETYPTDPKLQFLYGSLLAGAAQYDAARVSMKEAVRLAPDYALARFQLGFLELTSGDPAAAAETWRRLERLAPEDPLRLFADGLNHLIRDQFPEALARLRQGIALNEQNPALNADMGLIISSIEGLDPDAPPEDDVTAAHWLLQRYNDKSTTH